jgi:hypothetical protein
MEMGFLLELSHGYQRGVTRWIAGSPEKTIWMGLRLDGRSAHDVQTFRCRDCGFLESYAIG